MMATFAYTNTKFNIMKMKLLGTAFFMMLFLFNANVTVNAQEKYGKDSVECVKNLSLFGVYSKQESYDDALKHWRYCFNNCPSSSKALYINGAKMIKYIIEKNENKNVPVFEAYVDTLMQLYDKREKYFGAPGKFGAGYIKGRKGIDLLRYRKEAVEEGYGYLKESVKLQNEFVENAAAVTFMQASRQMLTMEKITPEVMINDFMLATDQLDKALKVEKDPAEKEKITTSISNCETIFIESGVASCQNLSDIFTPQFEKNKTDLDLLKKILKFCNKSECTDTKLFADVAEARYALEPSAEAAADLAQVFAKRENMAKAEEYYKQAVELETNPELKANYLYKLALISKMDNKYSDSRKYAQQAADLKGNWGDPYILIAALYAETSGSCGSDSDAQIADFQRRAVYWAAVDKLTKAKSIDPTVASVVQPLISRYASLYPNSEKAFMIGFKAGQRYTVGCWIQESVTIRFND